MGCTRGTCATGNLASRSAAIPVQPGDFGCRQGFNGATAIPDAQKSCKEPNASYSERFGDIIPVAGNQIENNMEHAMETGML